ncbi:MAG: ABC-2 family transporter protein [Candidatus Woesearchaeota archaeon]
MAADMIKNAQVVWWYFKNNLSSALEYRTNFFIGVVGMMVNNVVWIFFWYIILAKFDSIRGWDFHNILQLYAIATISWGLSGIFFGNRGQLATLIEKGALDFYLALPVNPLLHALVTRFPLGALGDLVFGIILAFFAIDLVDAPLFVLVTVLGAILTLGFCILVGSMGFFFGSSRSLERNMVMGLITFATYPLSIFGGVAKVILLTIIPAGFVTGIPVELLASFDLFWFMMLLIAVLVFLLVSISVFNYGLRRYESGNLIVERL